jgi:hypothetical protein
VLVPPGAGKSQTVDSVLAAGGAFADHCATCIDAARDPRLQTDARAVFEIARPDAATDATALIELAKHRGTVVILAAFVPAGMPQGWNVATFTLGSGWRERFVRWCIGRLEEPGELELAEITEWLAEVDPACTVVDSPGALLPLLGWAYRHGTPRDGIPIAAAESLVRARLIGSGIRGGEADAPASALPTLVLGSIDLRVDGASPRSPQDWSSLLPAVPLSADARALQQRELEALHASTRRNDKAQHKAELERLLDADPRHDVINALVNAELLVFGGNEFDVQPRWLRHAYERDAVARNTGEKTWERWGRWAAHPEYRGAVVSALAALKYRDFARIVDEVLASSHATLPRAAATEALFEAAVPLFGLSDEGVSGDAEGWRQNDTLLKTLQRLGVAQAKLVGLVARSLGEARPSRLTAVPQRHSAESVRWLASAWWFSARVPRPEQVDAGAAWALPGWSADLSAAVDVPIADAAREMTPEIVDAYRDLIRAARAVVASNPSALEAEAWPIQVAALIDGTALQRPLVGEVMNGRGAELLAHVVATQPKDVGARAAIAIWRNIHRSGSTPLVTLGFVQSQLVRDMLVSRLPAVEFVAGMNPDAALGALRVDPRAFHRLPLPWREAYLAATAATLAGWGRPDANSLRIEQSLGDIETFETLATIANVDGVIGDAAARRGWELDEVRALSELDGALATDRPAAGSWIGTCPTTRMREVAERVLRARPEPDARIRRWLVRAVGTGVRDAAALYDLLVGLGP